MTLVRAVRGSEQRGGGKNRVAPDGDGGGVARGLLFGLGWIRGSGGSGGGGRCRSADQVAADADIGVDDDAPAENDVLGSVQLGAAGDFVARISRNVVGFRFRGRHFWRWR